MKDRFRKLVSTQAELAPRLPLVHTTDTYLFVESTMDGSLAPQPCHVFGGEMLLYLFYGRPAYRVNASEEATGLSHYLPVCLIFPTTLPIDIERVVPFDSGSYAGRISKSFTHRRMELEDFFLDPDPSTPGRLLGLFYNSTAAYFDGSAAPPVDLAASEFEAKAYDALIRDPSSNTRDNRGSTVEVQTKSPIPISSAIAAIVPTSFADDSVISRYLVDRGIEILPYRQYDRMTSSEYVSQLFDIARAYYQQASLIP